MQWRVQAFAALHELQIVFHCMLFFCRICQLYQNAKFGPCVKPSISFLVWFQVAMQVLHVWCLSIPVVGVDDDLFAYDALGLIVDFVC